jgi:hypothetical protein
VLDVFSLDHARKVRHFGEVAELVDNITRARENGNNEAGNRHLVRAKGVGRTAAEQSVKPLLHGLLVNHLNVLAFHCSISN